MAGRRSGRPVKNRPARVPMIMQMEMLECGAACLAMILAYYGKWIPLEQVRADCGVSRDGSNAKNMILAARNYGLEARGVRAEPSDLRTAGEFPCILHWDFSHFVVLRGFRGNYALINDPARGNVRVSMEEFDRSFTGICLMFSPSETFQPEGRRRGIFSFIRRRMEGAGFSVAFVALTGLIGYIFTIINPGFARFFVDRLLTGENEDLLLPFFWVLLGITGLQILTTGLQSVYSFKMKGKMAVIGSSSFMWKILHMPMEFFSQRMPGDLLTRKASNEKIAASVVNTLTPLVLSTFMMVFYLIVMLRYSPLLTMIGVVSTLVNIGMSRLISAKRINYTRVLIRDAGKLAASTLSGIRMAETIKSSGAEQGFFSSWAGYQASVNRQTFNYIRLTQYLGAVPVFVSALANSLVMVAGVWLCIKGQFTLGMITAFQGFFQAFINPAMTLINADQSLQEMRTQMERLEDVMEYPEDLRFRNANGAKPEEEWRMTGDIELRHVTFGYSRLAEPLLKDISLHIPAGKSVAVVGKSGCGKSTLCRLLAGLYLPWSGEILFSGVPITEIDPDIFTASLAVADQESAFFEDTIENNLKMWDRSIEDWQMILAARDAQIHDVIMQRPGGYQCMMEENGSNFSGGQRQRLEVARALAQEPFIFIMDEATSALDARTEKALMKAVRDRSITCIIMAHRLSAIRDCDEIIVLDNGQIAERGTHEELCAKGGIYTELITSE